MATDFFDRQDYARRQTTRLIVLFALAVAAIIVAVYLVVAVGIDGAESSHHFKAIRGVLDPSTVHVHRGLWRPELFLGVAAGTLLVVALGSLYKISELSAGGESVALMLGGRAIDPQTTDLAERRLLNVVEEMAVASGIPVPPVFVLENEPSINAFAAGHQPGDAVVAVSAGALKYLSREELQGVMGHEFSHILNGDMRLNLRLIGVVNGILVLAIVGYYILRFGGSSSRSSEKSGGGAAILLLGLALVILGYIGVFFGNLIKAAISRQREFLADASAVQFTRYPGGIAGALKKIGGLTDGSRIRDGHAHEISHMFFGDAFAGAFFNLFATHPPLAKRIRALEPDFDGNFPAVEPVRATAESEHPHATRPAGVIPAIPVILGGAMPLDAATMTQRIGAPQPEHLEGANRMIADLPPLLLSAAREPFAAQAVVFVLLLSRDDAAVRTKQLQLLQSQIEPPLYRQMDQLAGAVQSLAATARLPLVDLSMPAIKRSSPQQYARFRQVVNVLVSADGKVDLFEYCLRTMLFSYLDVNFGLKKPVAVHYRSVDAVAQPLVVVLSTLAYVGQTDPEDIAKAFQAGSKNLPGQVTILPKPECTLEKLDAALGELAQSSPNVKREVIGAVTACIAADGQVTLEEGELLRAIAAVLACPMPPIAASV